MPKVKDIISSLSKKFNQEDNIAVGIWTAKDIKARERYLGIKLNNDEINDVLDTLTENFDPVVGISEEVIEDLICYINTGTGNFEEDDDENNGEEND